MRLFQNGTMQMLSEGLLDGTITLQELLKYGDTGIGTGEGIDGELVILDNTGYKIDENGTAKELDKNFNVVFADIHQSNYEYFDNFENIDLSHLMEQVKKNINGENYFFSIKLHGLFTKVKTRSTRKYSKPYPSLEEIAKNQIEFYAENIYGTLISYYTPIIYQGVAVAGFHSHFISDDKSMGGHVISANIGSVETCYQKFESFTQKFPLDSNSFTNADLSNTQNLDSIIKNVE
ncbi:acetolactate decarboxylase [Enterococcus alishanensis]|uniref:acetolactate decarboxylase n=1 Tax=Enterococcus alishanensis TaxID=1303817 RepID=UPI002484B3C1|nr:acetolactate decarboxylase [Enterococcus alishanensis]